jgi:hypothetical protein
MRGAAHVADSPLRIPAAQADDAREKPSQRARAGEAVVVDTQSQIAVGAGGVGGQQPPVDVAHRFRVSRGAVCVPVLLTLARAVAKRGRQPKILSRLARARQRQTEQGVDTLQLEGGRIERRGPPDVSARLEDEWRGITWIALGQSREIGGGALEVPAVQRVQPRAQRRRPLLQHQYDRGEQRHVSEERR